ncbi:MAG: hypothetical protein RIS05_407 [Actinomycetota bacterium]|jgi:hypothetical protein
MLEVGLVVIYAVVVILIVARFDRPAKKGPRITGRGGDFE